MLAPKGRLAVNPIMPLAQAEAPDAGILAGGLCVIIAIGLIGLVSFVIWIWALIDAIKNPALDSNMRLIWILVLVFTGVLGAIVYLLIGRSKT
jgi:hypothetical protein